MRLILFFTIIITLFSCQHKEEETLVIASAASLSTVLKELIIEFSKQTNIEVTTIIGASGKLTAQIEAGAPYDVFLSANSKYPLYLKEKLQIKSNLTHFAYGKLAFLVSKEIKNNNANQLKDLQELNKIVIPNPQLAPYGIAAQEVLIKKGILKLLKPKLVFAENVTQTNQFLKSKVVTAGFTSLSSVKAYNFQENYRYLLVPDSLYSPIINTFLITSKNKEKQKKALQFKTFLQSKIASTIFKKYGYRVL